MDLDYGNRPSKAVTRRILMALLQRLQAFEPTSKYDYVGFGAIQFIDFDMVHRMLGVTRMTSIESEEKLLPRCNFNKPFKGIRVLEGSSGTVLPTLDWTKRAIVWLDYTSKLRNTELSDLENLALVLQPGSVVVITLNCSVPQDEDARVPELEKAVGAELTPLGVSGARLGGWGLAEVQRALSSQLLDRTLSGRGEGLSWQQLLNIHYRDGAPMQLVAGIVDGPDVHEGLQRCRFGDMDEVRTGEEALLVEIPILTNRERQALNAKLPGKVPSSFAGIPQEALQAYADMYRWLESVG